MANDFSNKPSVNDLANRIAGLSADKRALLELEIKKRGTRASGEPTIPRSDSRDSVPLSFAQQRLWFLDQYEPNSSVYNVSGALRFRGKLKIDALQRSIEEIVGRHEALRTTFSMVDGEPVQIVAPAPNLSLPVVDLAERLESEREQEARRLAREEALRPFDLTRGPVFRATLIRLGETDHLLLLALHHIVCDGWSLGVLYRELSALYGAFASGKPAPLEPLPVQYADFAVWQRNWLQGEVLESQLSYWTQQLEGAPAVLNLPTDRPRPALQSFRGRRQSIVLSDELTHRLQALSRREGVTLFMTLLAAFQTLLHRYTGQDDIVVGSPIANRNRTEIEGLIGFFVNTLVLRADLSGNPTFQQLLARVREVALGAYAHQDLPFEKLVDELRPERSLSHSPLFQVMFVLQNAPSRDPEFSGLSLDFMAIGGSTAKFDLLLSMNESAGGLRASLEYSTDLFDAATVQRMLGHFQTLLAEIVARPEQRISDLPILTEAESDQLRMGWNNTEKDFPRDKCVHELFEEQARRSPESVALVLEDQRLTYRELNQRANQLAHYLQDLGVGPEKLVGICVERSPEMVIGLLGILKAGGAYVPLDPGYPRDRLAFMLADTQAPVLITTQRLLEGLPNYEGRIVCLDAEWESISHQTQQEPVSKVTTANLAYAIYTSGSSGKPKAVAMSHRSLCNLLSWQAQNSTHPTPARTLQFASLSFDVSFQEIFATFCSGGTLVLIPEELRRDAVGLLHYLRDQSVERLFLPFVALQQLAETAGHEKTIPESLREIITAGEQLHITAPIISLFNKLKDCKLHNQYGPSESHVVTAFTLTGPSDMWPSRPPIGRPIDNTQIFLLDRYLNPAPIGVSGELCIGGDSLARSYLNRPELTAEKFIPNPFGSKRGALYRTGDLARYLPDGNIEFLGRTDNQVKMRSFRIELGEIEAVLGQHPAVRETVVTAREDTPGDPSAALSTAKRLVAYVVSNREMAPTSEDLRSFLRQKLPDYMVPSAFVLLDSLPLTPNGKVDRRALPVPDQSRPELEEAFVAARTAVEEVVAGIWEKVLGIGKIGVHDNFFDLGGHSLKATQVMFRLREAYQIDLPLRALFETPTVAGLAARIEGGDSEQQRPQHLPLRAVSREKNLPLSFAQQRLWFWDQLEPDSSIYNIPSAFRLEGVLDIASLQRSINEILRRHEGLRTVFARIEGDPIQRILPFSTLPLPVVDLADRSEGERENEARRLGSEEAGRPFDLTRGPLFRAALLRLGEEEHILLLTMHHIVSDGWSLGVFYRELSVLYEAFSRGQPSPLPDLPIQYPDFAVWQRNWLQGLVLESQLSYWKKQLEDVSVLRLPADRPRPAVQSHRGAKESLIFSHDLSEKLKALSRKEDVTLFMTMLAAFQAFLHRYTGQNDIAVGTPIAGRSGSEIEGLIGFFVNTLVMRADLSGEPTFRELLARVREMALGAYAHQDMPFEKLVEELHPQRNLTQSPLFQVMFSFQNTPRESVRFKGLTVTPIINDSATTKFDLSLSMREEAEGLNGTWRYNVDLFSAATIRRMTEHFRQLVQEILQYPDQPVGELQLISSAERRQLVEVWSGAANADSDETSGHHHPIEERETPARPSSAAEYTKQPLTLTGMIAAWAQRTPDTAAIEAPGRRPLTYHQLLVHIKVVAEKLQEFGIKRSDRVALVLPDGPEAAVAFLAVASVAAGAPLNRAYRFEEFEFYLKHLNARALIVQAGDDSSARAVAQARGIPVLELFPRLDSEAGLFTVVGEREPTAGSTDHAGPGEAALILHTSGTTSQPKLVSLTHANLLASAGHITATLALSRNDRCLNIMPLYHVHGLVGGLLSSLAAGASIVCTPGFSAPEFFGWVDAFRPTWYSAVPTMHQAILARAETNQTTIGRYPLRFIRSSSAALPPPLLEQLETIFQVPVIESYGMTESAHQICSNPLPPGRRKAGSVGVGAGPEVAIMDQLGNILLEGTSGEVVIRGANVCQEYDNNPDANTAAFTEGWFHTGDQGYLDSDGYLFLTGRFKEIINRGGEKISPLEVDEVLLDHPAVTQAVTFPVPHPSLGEEVAAAVVLRQPHTVTARQLREFAAARLVDFKVPRQVVILGDIPKSSTGKVQRIGLADQLGLTASDQLTTGNISTFEPPQPGTEEALACIWAQLLGLEHIGRYDNFFQSGGDSLLAARIINRVYTRVGVRVSFIDFFENPTVAGLAETIERGKHANQPLRLPTMRPLSRTAALPLSYAQQALWFLHQLHPHAGSLNRALALRLTGSLDAGAMQKSLNLIVNRHEALRTTFPILQDAPMQVIKPPQPLALRTADLSAMPPPDREAEAKEVLLEEARRPFDLAHGPVLRSALMKLSKEDHVVIVIFHHIAADGWSDTVFLRELATAYNAITAGVQPDLPALHIQYADFAAWQREMLQGERVEKLLGYWKQQIGTGRSHLKFSTSELQRTPGSPRQGAHQVLDLPGPLSRALKRLSAKEEVTLFMTLLAGFKTLLYRYTGQEDLLVGTPIAGRNAEELEEVIGNFTNLLGLRTDLSGNPSFRALLDRVRQVTLQAYAHQDLPLGRLAEALRKEMGLDITVPFQVMFGLRNFPSQPPRFTGLQAAGFEFDDGIARFDLSLDIVEKPDGVRCLFAYDTALFDQATMTRLMRHFRTLLEAIVADPDARIDSLLLLDASERHAALSRSVTKGDDIKGPRGIHHIFEEQVARTPAATAVSDDGSGLSYAELNGRANRLAHYLRGLGVGPDILVGICVERSLEMAVGVLGILKAGGAYVPLDPKYPKERLAFLLEDTKVGVVLTQQQLVSALPPRKARLVLLDTDWPKIAREAKQDPAGNSVADNLAYVIYTSGSTGKPKGVLITHGGVVNHSVAMARHFALRPEDRVAQCASLSFDISVEELFPSWISGASLVLCPPAIFSPGTELVRWLDYEQITAVNLPTAFWHEWVCHLERSHESIPRSLRLVVVGGEKASAEALAKWKGCAGTHARWINTYGPTEATVTTTVYEPPPDSMAASTLREIPIGQPITGNQAYILDRHLNPVPIGVVGELCIGGAGLARGYHNHPELTSEKFIANPFSTDPGARLYRTGDLTRYRSDGAIEFIGRIDSQVKIRGFRIEIGEIEAVLSQHPSVHDNVVVVREDEFNDRRLIAYVVLNQGLSPENPDLRGFLLGKMPEYMVPSAFEIIAALPLNANGKIDRRALPAPKGMRPDLKENFVPPRNKTEEQLAHIWSKFLGVKQVGIRDNFFVLGGHSLLAVRLFAEIEKEFKRRLSLSSLFEEATIEHLAGLIKQSGPLTSRSCVVAIQPRGTKLPFFCVHEFFGDVLCYINLARHLGPEQPFYALQARGLDGIEEPFTEIEAMAAYYIEQIRTVQPHGPYGLGGLCSGGVVAFEMAQQLLSQGESVSLLALLDSGVRSGNNKAAEPGFLGRFARDFPSWLIGSFELTRSQWLGLVKLKLSRAKARLATSFRLSPSSGPDSVSNLIKDMGDLFGFSEQHRKVAFAQRRALRQYQPRIYRGRLTLFRARMQPLFSSHNPDKGWGQLAAGGLDIRVVPSNHLGMLQEPHVRVVAEQLKACLDDAELASEKSSLST